MTGYLGIVLAAFAAFLAIPPIEARTITWPIVVGIVAVLLGVWTVTRGRRRLGWGAFAAGLLGIGLGVLATHSSTDNLNGASTHARRADVRLATPLVFGAMAGIFSERSGVVNIGLEGMMLMGAFWGVYGADKGGSWVVGLRWGGRRGLLALVYAFFAIHLRADQIVGGTGVNFLAVGITGYFFVQLYNGNSVSTGVSLLPNVHLGFADELPRAVDREPQHPDLGGLRARHRHVRRPLQDADRAADPRLRRAPARGGHGRDQRLRDPVRLRRPVGVPRGDRRGLPVRRAGGGTFIDNMTNGRGFIALAAMIFGNWRPAGAFAAALLFGFSSALALRLQVYSPSAATLFNVLP